MSCNNGNNVSSENVCCHNNTGVGYVTIIVLYILLAIIIGSALFV